MLNVLVGLFAIATGVLGIVRPRLLFDLRHPVSVTSESGLNRTGILLYRLGGVLSIIVGGWVLIAWG